ncbi:hypothetical protein [Nonomuraea longicatena]|uniref:DUF4352 domain-containing protein n=1 Tax=Nonomuraea longicatena TaxID=83682 RepID=A0ABN1QTL4_9ACTN
MTAPSGEHDRPKRPVVVPVIGLVLATAAGVTALLGGLNEVPDAPPQLAKGAVLDQGQFKTRFVDAVVSTQRAPQPAEPDRRFLEVTFDVTNQGERTAAVGIPPQRPESAFSGTTFAGSLVKITPGFAPESGPFVFALSEGVESRQLHPGVATTVVLRYRLEPEVKVPDKIVFDVAGFEYTAGFQDPDLNWRMVSTEEAENTFVPEVKAQVTLPVTVREPV